MNFDAKMGSKMTLRSFRFALVESQRAPKCIKNRYFSGNGRFGDSLAPFGSLLVWILLKFYRFGTSFWLILAAFAPFPLEFSAQSERLGGGGGMGNHSFLNHISQHQIIFSIHNLWLARCGLALQLGYIYTSVDLSIKLTDWIWNRSLCGHDRLSWLVCGIDRYVGRSFILIGNMIKLHD